MLKKYTCIICPNGCEIEAEIENGEIVAVSGATCPKGEAYVRQEITAPQRNIATSILVKNGELPLASVRLTRAIPRERIFDAMQVIRTVVVEAPVQAGTVVVEKILGYDSDVIVTKSVARR